MDKKKSKSTLEIFINHNKLISAFEFHAPYILFPKNQLFL